MSPCFGKVVLRSDLSRTGSESVDLEVWKLGRRRAGDSPPQRGVIEPSNAERGLKRPRGDSASVDEEGSMRG